MIDFSILLATGSLQTIAMAGHDGGGESVGTRRGGYSKLGASEVEAGVNRAVCGGESSTPDTKVVMANGSTTRLDQVKVWDRVKATYTKTGKTSAQTVTAVWVNLDTDLIDITVSVAGTTAKIHATAHHLFWVPTAHAWVEADRLTAGQTLLSDAGAAVTVPGAAPIWDLTIAGDHDFYIVTTWANVLVHNCPVLGEGGTQTNSTTVLRDTGQGYRIDVETLRRVSVLASCIFRRVTTSKSTITIRAIGSRHRVRPR